MKKILFIFTFLLFYSLANGQDWRTVTSGKTFFQVPVDSFAINGIHSLIRSAAYDSVTVQGSDSIFYFPVTSRIMGYDSLHKCLDTLHGSWWLGFNMVRNINGDETYQNTNADAILFKTKAPLNASWTGATILGNTYTFTVTQIDTMTVDGVVDSIKRISISSSSASPYNGHEFVLSKEHGFLQTFEIYFFGLHIFGGITGDYFDQSYIHPFLFQEHKRLPLAFNNQHYHEIDLTYRYNPGNAWTFEKFDILGGPHVWYRYTLYDSILSSTLLSSNSISVTFRRDSVTEFGHPLVFDPWGNPIVDTVELTMSTNNIITDTFYSTPYVLNSDTLKPENISYLDTLFYSKALGLYSLDTLPNNKWLVKYSTDDNHSIEDGDTTSQICLRYQFTVSGVGYYKHNYFPGFGTSLDSFANYNGFQQLTFEHYERLLYAKLNGMIWGRWINLGTHNLEQLTDVRLYPNPTSHTIHLDSGKLLHDVRVSMYNGMGVLVYQCKDNTFQVKDIPVTSFTDGEYFLLLQSSEGIFKSKLTVRRD